MDYPQETSRSLPCVGNRTMSPPPPPRSPSSSSSVHSSDLQSSTSYISVFDPSSSDPSSVTDEQPKEDDHLPTKKRTGSRTYGPYNSYSEQLKSQLLYPVRIPGLIVTRFKNRNLPKPETRSPTKLHDPSSFPPPPPSVLIANPGIIAKRRAYFMKPRNKLVRKSVPPWPFDVFYDYQHEKYAVHLRNARPHRFVGKILARKSRKQASDDILQPRMNDSPLQSVYRMYEYIVVDSRKEFYSEVEYFYNQTDWAISEIPDPRYNDYGAGGERDDAEVDNDPARLAVLAVTVKILVKAFNALHKHGMRKNADVSIDGKKATTTTPCAIRFDREELPDWIQEIQPLAERTFLPHGGGDSLLDENDEGTCPLFWAYNIVRRRVQVQFHLYTREKKSHRPSKQVVEDFGKDSVRKTIKSGVAVGHATVKTGVGIKNASVKAGEFAKERGKAGAMNTKRTVNVVKGTKGKKKVVKKVWHVWMDGKYKTKIVKVKAAPREDDDHEELVESNGNEEDRKRGNGEENEEGSRDENENQGKTEDEEAGPVRARGVKVLPRNIQIIPDKNGKTVRKITKLETDVYLIEIRQKTQGEDL